jgi:hypothetical protein
MIQTKPRNLAKNVSEERYLFKVTPDKILFISGIPDPACFKNEQPSCIQVKGPQTCCSRTDTVCKVQREANESTGVGNPQWERKPRPIIKELKQEKIQSP